ncbi:MAG: thiamine pyrophosphate-dependent dehydrogenase E1 component subunit alpha [Bdellovibrionaceae bacterium]|nr:thiamine pyrophosphate-dependent dehydrogenase E1 component subunit alpha [Pseudobdellovibrionaceae bacterium]
MTQSTASAKNSSAKRAPLKKAVSKTAGKTSKKVAPAAKASGDRELKLLPKELCLKMYNDMVKSRVLEDRLIKIYKAGESYFWIGAPGEEAWGVALGHNVNKGQGPDYDYLHLHYRCTPTLVALGLEMIDSIRLMMNRTTDPSTGGRNFSNHYVFPKWNVAPVTSPIEVQYIIALGTAHVQKRRKTKGITIVSGGDAGTAEGDFASSLIWASRKGRELPMLLTVQNNKWGISTSYDGQHGETNIADRAKAFNIRARVIDGNNPIESYLTVQEDMNYIRKTGKPAFIEARLSRLYGHSSASGANFVDSEIDPVRQFEKRLLKAGYLKETDAKEIWAAYEAEGVGAQTQARLEPVPTPESIWDHVYFGGENADWRKF